ncbi:TatD family hydrolase [Dongia rigui]|uniref:TatD family hydrolase n=1 Tax=Dongia rigui TaxID=940149 RepID=A0ABU5E3U4_9PROT|nr:TatD family hydrolase [Dongia rigui]MDY0874255.1 TatD family hydrolase [Dongia rigui]
MTLNLVDSHCHLDFEDFGSDFDAVLARAKESGVARMLTICTRVTKFEQVLKIAEASDNIRCTVGIHPHEAENEPDVDVARLAELAKHPKVVGIGEAGLDYFYDKSPRQRQQEVFATHIEASRVTGLPIVVHSRDADEDTVRLLQDGAKKGGLTGVIHCFTSTQYLADAALEMGFYISLSGIVTFKSAAALRDVAKTIPHDRLLVETDSPYLAPIPMRGKRNEPAFVTHTAGFVADFLGMPLADLAAKTTANFDRLFTKAAA